MEAWRLTRVGEAERWCVWWFWEKKVEEGEEKVELEEEAKELYEYEGEEEKGVFDVE